VPQEGRAPDVDLQDALVVGLEALEGVYPEVQDVAHAVVDVLSIHLAKVPACTNFDGLQWMDDTIIMFIALEEVSEADMPCTTFGMGERCGDGTCGACL